MNNHAPWGKVAQQRLRANPNYIISIFEGMTENEIKACVKRAWETREKIRKQNAYPGDSERIIYRGLDPETGYTVEIIQNKDTGIIETAYPVEK